MKSERHIPPRPARRLLKYFLRGELIEEVTGDLEEKFQKTVKTKSIFRARLNYWWQVINYARPFALRHFQLFNSGQTYSGMYRNYLKIAFRNIIRQKFYSFINIGGLSIGLVISLLILLFVAYEFSYDRFNVNGDRIFRVEKQFSRDGRYSLYANPDFAPEIKNLDRHVVNYVRLFNRGRKVVESDSGHRYFEDRFLFADSSLFSIFSFRLEKGSASSLAGSYNVIITESTARKYFGENDPLGKILIYDKDYPFVVSGVTADPPDNSSLQFDFIASFPTLMQMPDERNILINNSSAFPTYSLLAKRNDVTSVKRSILKTGYTNKDIAYDIKPLYENHLNKHFGDPGISKYVMIFLYCGLLILGLALFNYLNLSTARSTMRAKEVGIRKVIGAAGRSLSIQFYIESAVTCIISIILAAGMVIILEPPFMNILQIRMSPGFLLSPFFLGFAVTLLLVSILLAGIYPALVMPRFKPVLILKGKLSERDHGHWFRKTLTVIQFSVSVSLIICTLTMNRQLNFMMTKNTGLARDQVIAVPVDPGAAGSYQALKYRLKDLPGVTGVAGASIPIYKANLSGISWVRSPVSDQKVGTKWIMVDHDFPEVLGIGWEDKPESGNMAGNFLINETAADAFAFDSIKTGYNLSMGDPERGITKGKIVGVTKDFNYRSLRHSIEPLIISVIPDTTSRLPDDGTLYIRLAAHAPINNTILSIKKIYDAYSADYPFTYYFIDDAFNQMQAGEKRLSEIFSIFSFIALLIACLGLFALSALTAERRGHEISIRKVLGATGIQIIDLLSRNFLYILLVSVVIAIPVSKYLMGRWLQDFAFRISIGWDIFFFAGLAALIVSLVTISYQSVKTALINPVEKLRSE